MQIAWATKGLQSYRSGLLKARMEFQVMLQTAWSQYETKNTGSVVGTLEGPGDFVSVDQMIAGSPGLIPFTSGQPSNH